MINIHDALLKRIILVVLSVSVLGILASNLFVYPTFTKVLINDTESEAVRIGNHMATMLFPEGAQVNAVYMTQKQRHINEIIDDFTLYKLKVFVPSGEIVFSTDSKEIGDKNEHDYFHNVVSSGRVFTKIVKKNSLSLEGQTIAVDVVETYVPIMRNGAFVGALEIYYDITDQVKIIADTLILCNAMSIGFFLVFFIICLVIVRKLDINISEREEAREHLGKTNCRLALEIDHRIKVEQEKETLIKELQGSLEKIKVLKGLVPICSFCKNIRNDSGYWEQMEEYIEKYSDAEFSHGLCPDCAEKHYPDLHLNEDDATFEKKMIEQRDQEDQEENNKSTEL